MYFILSDFVWLGVKNIAEKEVVCDFKLDYWYQGTSVSYYSKIKGKISSKLNKAKCTCEAIGTF